MTKARVNLILAGVAASLFVAASVMNIINNGGHVTWRAIAGFGFGAVFFLGQLARSKSQANPKSR